MPRGGICHLGVGEVPGFFETGEYLIDHAENRSRQRSGSLRLGLTHGRELGHGEIEVPGERLHPAGKQPSQKGADDKERRQQRQHQTAPLPPQRDQ